MLLRTTAALMLSGCSLFGRSSAPVAPPDDMRCDKVRHNECFVYFEGGTFLIGAQAADPQGPRYDPDASDNEGPPTAVTVAPFWIARNEAPMGMLRRCIDESACPAEAFASTSPIANINHPELINNPINAVTWSAAQTLCARAGGRLPTEAEWEFAARGTTDRRWPWGDEAKCGVADPEAMSVAKNRPSHPPMAKPPCVNEGTVALDGEALSTDRGMGGMGGNVAEWVEDLAHRYGEPPKADEARRIQRGGGWMSTDPADLRVTARVPAAPEEAMPDVGFRCVYTGAQRP